MDSLKTTFIELFESSESIEVDGTFCRYFDNTVHQTTDDPDELLIDISGMDCPIELIIKQEDMDSITLSECGRVWEVGSYSVAFYGLLPLITRL